MCENCGDPRCSGDGRQHATGPVEADVELQGDPSDPHSRRVVVTMRFADAKTATTNIALVTAAHMLNKTLADEGCTMALNGVTYGAGALVEELERKAGAGKRPDPGGWN